MQRRELLILLAGGTAGALLAPLSAADRLALGSRVHRGELGPATPLPRADLVSRLADLILPATETPGALDVGVPAFIATMLSTWHTASERADIDRGLAALDERAGRRGFLALSESRQVRLLESIDGASGTPGSPEHAFRALKWLTIYGYFTSERVQREVLETVVVPGRFEPCVPLVKG